MNKAIKKYWGVGLIVIMLASMIVLPASVSADDNAWTAQSTPSGAPGLYTTKNGSDVADFAVQGNGAVVYAVTGDNFTYKSTNGGVYWAATQSAAMADITPDLIAIAPDNANYIAIADISLGMVKVSVNGGVTFATISPVLATNTGNTLNAIKDLTISPTRLGANYVTVCGTDNASIGGVFYYNLGAVVGQQWTERAPANNPESVDAVAFSPNFISDLTMVALTDNGTTTNKVALQVYSFSSGLWNTADYPNYPVNVVTDVAPFTVTYASLALDPAFLGGEDSLRNTYIGIDTTSATIDGIYRVLNATSRNLAAGNIYSVAYDGTTLVAGQTDSTSVLRSLDPMSSIPTVTGTSTYKSVGGVGTVKVNVGFVGANVAAGSSGANSAFALSRSSGAAFNDVSLIDTAITNARDFAVSADSSKLYYLTDNGAYTSLWFKSTGWERVLTFAYTNPFIVRLSPTNPDVVYLGEKTGTKVYYSKDVQSRWYQRTSTDTAGIADMAVESDDVAYILDPVGSVVKSTNDGFIWTAVPIATKLTSGYSLVSAKENVLFAGAAAGGRVAYSLDGGTTWTAIPAGTEVGAGAAIVLPDENYATNNIIYVGTTTAQMNIMSYTIGTSTAWSFYYQASQATFAVSESCYGLAMKNGTFYALTVDTVGATTNVTRLYQYIPSVRAWANVPAATYYPPVGAAENVACISASPNGLRASATTGANKLWAIKTNVSQVLLQLNDTLAAAAPVITGPADKTSVTASNGVSNVVILTWNRAANATTHTIQVAFDSAFTQIVNTYNVNFPPNLNQVIVRDALPAGTTFYWRIRASAPLNSPYSETRSLTVQALPASVPVISSPTNGATILSQSPAFSWTPVTGTTKYDFQLSTTPTFGTAVTVFSDQPTSTGALVPVTIKLEQGKQYFWRVRALEPVAGDWSAVANFIVALPATTNPPVVITQVPAPIITIPAAPSVPAITLAPAPVNQIAPTYIWAIIIIGAILVIAVIVLIVRTRRSV